MHVPCGADKLCRVWGRKISSWGYGRGCLSSICDSHQYVVQKKGTCFKSRVRKQSQDSSLTDISYLLHEYNYSIWVTMNGLAQVLGSLLMYGIGKQHYPRLEPWRVLFLVCGALTAAFGVVFYFLVPTGPQKAWFLSEREREVLLARMAQDREGGDRTNFSKAQVIETLLDVRAWFIFAFGILVTMQSPVLTVCYSLTCRRWGKLTQVSLLL